MPKLVEGSEVAGPLRDSLKAAWGLSHPVAVAGGAGDNAAAACGTGALKEGQGFVSLGTSGVVFLARGQSSDRCAHVLSCCSEPVVSDGRHALCHR